MDTAQTPLDHEVVTLRNHESCLTVKSYNDNTVLAVKRDEIRRQVQLDKVGPIRDRSEYSQADATLGARTR